MPPPVALKFYWNVLVKTFSKFSDDDLFTNAAALSYYTIFSLPPMLLVIVVTASQFYNKATVEETLFSQIGQLVGADGARQLSETIKKLNLFEGEWWAIAMGIGALIFTSTTVFVTMQNTLNKIFKVKPKPEGLGILKLIKDRVLSFTMLIGVAFILLVSLVIDALLAVFNNYLENWIGVFSTSLMVIISMIVPLVIITVMFAAIFKFLPDAEMKWKDTWFGAIITALLFSVGKYGISFYIGQSNIAGLYDAAGSIMIIMVWVFYASLIFMLGAVFTFVYTKMMGEKIEASEFAVKVKVVKMEVENSTSG